MGASLLVLEKSLSINKIILNTFQESSDKKIIKEIKEKIEETEKEIKEKKNGNAST